MTTEDINHEADAIIAKLRSRSFDLFVRGNFDKRDAQLMEDASNVIVDLLDKIDEHHEKFDQIFWAISHHDKPCPVCEET